jgi:hypothetical protein
MNSTSYSHSVRTGRNSRCFQEKPFARPQNAYEDPRDFIEEMKASLSHDYAAQIERHDGLKANSMDERPPQYGWDGSVFVSS